MVEKKLTLEEALTIIEKKLDGFSNKEIVEIILKWENNPFVEEKMQEHLLQDNKKANVNKLIEKLKQRYDAYVVSYINFYPVYKSNSINLDDDLQGILDDLMVDFELTNSAAERELNRSQVEKIALNAEYVQSIYDYINDRLIDIDFIEDEDDDVIDSLINTILTAFMIEMLYWESRPLDYEGLKKFQSTLFSEE